VVKVIHEIKGAYLITVLTTFKISVLVFGDESSQCHSTYHKSQMECKWAESWPLNFKHSI